MIKGDGVVMSGERVYEDSGEGWVRGNLVGAWLAQCK